MWFTPMTTISNKGQTEQDAWHIIVIVLLYIQNRFKSAFFDDENEFTTLLSKKVYPGGLRTLIPTP